MLSSRMKLVLSALGLAVILIAKPAPSSATVVPRTFSTCSSLCPLVDCWSAEEGYCPGHCNTMCWVCG